MKFNLKLIFIFLFILFTFSDIISTILVSAKHGTEFESNPYVVLGIPLWVLLILKLIFTLAFVYILIKYYLELNIFLRYTLIYFLMFYVIIQLVVSIGNFDLFRQEIKEIEPLPKEERIEYYKENIGDMKIVNNVLPKEGFKIPLVFSLLVYNLVVFAVWLSFEKGG